MIGDQYVLTNKDKQPVNIAGFNINHLDPTNWMSREQAEGLAAQSGFAIAYVITENNPVVCIDIDDCRDPETGTYDDRAIKWGNALNGCFVEVSRSGRGLHFWGVAEQGLGDIFYNRKDGIEFYEKDRFIVLGSQGQGDPGLDITTPLKANLTPRPVASALPESGPVPEYTGPADDHQLIQMALNAKGSAAASFGDKARFVDLWQGNPDVLARFFPSDTPDKPFDYSRADSALLTQLAFWTGKDAARMERLWLASPLAKSRPDQKKLQRNDYRQQSVRGAGETCGAVYSKPAPQLPGTAPAVHDTPGLPTSGDLPTEANGGYMTIYEQEAHFEGCIYVRADNKVLVPDGELLDAKQFRVEYGGYEFQMQADGSRPTRDAWEAFTINRCKRFARAKWRGFMPQHPFGVIVNDRVNMYVPPKWRDNPTEGDVTPFLNVLERLLPNERDRQILLTWFASMVQNPGVKFQWAVALQGAEGNGKSFIFHCLRHAVGTHNTHMPNPEDMNEKYNDYLQNNLLIGVEEIHMNGRRDLLDRLKKYITGDLVEIRSMNKDKFMGENLTNWVFLTNYRDAVLKTRSDRRYAVFFCAQQSVEDIERDGMGGDFWPQMWDWARNGGFDIIATWLSRMTLVEQFNPAGSCNRAPETSSTEAAISESLGRIEQEIMNSVEAEMPGFCGGWISSIKLNDMLKAENIRVSKHALAEAVANLGYDKVETYFNGRAPKLSNEGGLRPVLYVHKSMLGRGLTMMDYAVAQGYVTEAPAPSNVVPMTKKDPA